MRVLIEALYVTGGIAIALLIGSLCAWAYPLAQRDVWLVTYAVVIAIVLLGIGPMRRACAAHRARHGQRAGKSVPGDPHDA